MKRLKSFYQLDEFYQDKAYISLKSDEICVKLYNVLILLVKGEYSKIYNELYSNYDMLYQMFKSDDDVAEFLENMRVAVDNKNFYEIYDPINKIINKLIEKNHKR